MADLLNFTRSSDPPEEDFGPVRGTEVLAKLIERHPEWEGALTRAHGTLRSDPHYAAAMHAVARSLQSKTINVFISYRSNRDARAAKALTTAFRELSGRSVDVTLAHEFATNISGKDYKEEISARVQEAHWFVLLSSDHSLSPWCMFETGMFRSTMISKRINRLICIAHRGGTLPDPIHEFQSVFGEEESLIQLFTGLFKGPEPLPGWEPLSPDLERDAIAAAAREVEEAFAPLSEPVEFNRTVVLSIPDSQELHDPSDLELAGIKTDPTTARLFGKARPPQTWGELTAGVVQRNNTKQVVGRVDAGPCQGAPG